MKIRSGIVAMNLITGHALGILTSLYILKFPLSFQGLSWSWLGKSCLIWASFEVIVHGEYIAIFLFISVTLRWV